MTTGIGNIDLQKALRRFFGLLGRTPSATTQEEENIFLLGEW